MYMEDPSISLYVCISLLRSAAAAHLLILVKFFFYLLYLYVYCTVLCRAVVCPVLSCISIELLYSFTVSADDTVRT